MAFLGGFDADKVVDDLTPVPEGEYVAIIVKSEMKRTKNGEGELLALEFKLQGPTHKGRTIKHRLNLKNKSELAVKIANGELAKICKSVGVLRPTDSSELHNIPMTIMVKVSDDAKWNEIKNFLPYGAAAPAGQESGSGSQQGNSNPPPSWMA